MFISVHFANDDFDRHNSNRLFKMTKKEFFIDYNQSNFNVQTFKFFPKRFWLKKNDDDVLIIAKFKINFYVLFKIDRKIDDDDKNNGRFEHESKFEIVVIVVSFCRSAVYHESELESEVFR